MKLWCGNIQLLKTFFHCVGKSIFEFLSLQSVLRSSVVKYSVVSWCDVWSSPYFTPSPVCGQKSHLMTCVGEDLVIKYISWDTLWATIFCVFLNMSHLATFFTIYFAIDAWLLLRDCHDIWHAHPHIEREYFSGKFRIEVNDYCNVCKNIEWKWGRLIK